MEELLKLLDGSVDSVKTSLAGLSRENLLALQEAEKNGKTRKGVLDAIAEALAPADEDEGRHPALAGDPRADKDADQNRIDFNDPTLSGSEAVAKNLEDQK